MTRLAVCLAAAFLAPPQIAYKVQLTAGDGNRIVKLTSEQYVAAVLAGESSTFRNPEALKAMAVVARTYAARLKGRHSAAGFDFCSTTHCQRVDLAAVSARLTEAASATAGELLWFDGKPLFAVYSRDCGGRSEECSAVWPDIQAPYLRIHDDPYCTRHGRTQWIWKESLERIGPTLRRQGLQTPEHLHDISIGGRTASRRAKILDLRGGHERIRISATSLRFAIGRELGWNNLRSELYEVETRGGFALFEGTGAGHGVGLCQRGAEEMALEGLSYREILAFYYPGTTLAFSGAGIAWMRLGGEGITIFSTQPDQERSLLPIAERARKNLEARLGMQMPAAIEIRLYPDLDRYRNATGEPGWVAARTRGHRIDLQPPEVLKRHGVLEQTIQHEIAHALVESVAAPGLPLWFREGLAEYLVRPSPPAASHGPLIDDAALNQRQDPALARHAHVEANARVAELFSRYGELTVLGWLRRGLPAEVTNASVSKPPTNSR